jgi:hypothetical protein
MKETNKQPKAEIVISYDPDSRGQISLSSTEGTPWNSLGLVIEAVILLMKSEENVWTNAKGISDSNGLLDYVIDYLRRGLEQHSKDDVILVNKKDAN